jgi:hypothetical protein
MKHFFNCAAIPAVAIAILFMAAALPAQAQTGIIRELSGTVELKPAGAANFAAASVGDEIAPNTVVSTGFRSTATIAVGSATIIVRPLTRLTMTEITSMGQTETINVNLAVGRVRVDVTPPAGTKTNFKVKSPTATASVRGTGFELDTYNLYVLHGVVDYQGSSGAPMRVGEGGGSFVGTSTGQTVDPLVIYEAELWPAEPVAGPPAGNGEAPSGPMLSAPGGSPARTPDYGVSINLK